MMIKQESMKKYFKIFKDNMKNREEIQYKMIERRLEKSKIYKDKMLNWTMSIETIDKD